MKKWWALGLSVVLLMSLTACGDGDFRYGMTQLELRNYAKAYDLFSESDNPQAAEMLKNFVFLPTEQVTVGVGGKESRRTFTYDDQGRLIREELVAEEQRDWTEYAYDPYGRLLTATGDDGIVKRYAYDAAGNRISYQREDGATTLYREEYVYNDNGKRIKTTISHEAGDKTVTEWAYDAAGNVTWVKNTWLDKNGVVTEWDETTAVYDAGGNKTKAIRVDMLGNETEMRFEYDSAGRMTAEYYPGGKNMYTYDERGNLLAKEIGIGQRYEYTYDENGNLLLEKNADDHLTVYVHDEMGRLQSQTYGNGEVFSCTYDRYGNKIEERYTNGLERIAVWQYAWAVYYCPEGTPEISAVILEEMKERPIVK